MSGLNIVAIDDSSIAKKIKKYYKDLSNRGGGECCGYYGTRTDWITYYGFLLIKKHIQKHKWIQPGGLIRLIQINDLAEYIKEFLFPRNVLQVNAEEIYDKEWVYTNYGPIGTYTAMVMTAEIYRPSVHQQFPPETSTVHSFNLTAGKFTFKRNGTEYSYPASALDYFMRPEYLHVIPFEIQHNIYDYYKGSSRPQRLHFLIIQEYLLDHPDQLNLILHYIRATHIYSYELTDALKADQSSKPIFEAVQKPVKLKEFIIGSDIIKQCLSVVTDLKLTTNTKYLSDLAAMSSLKFLRLTIMYESRILDKFCQSHRTLTRVYLKGIQVSNIGNYFFDKCTALEEITLAAVYVTDIGDYFLSDCIALKTVNLNVPSLQRIGGKFMYIGELFQKAQSELTTPPNTQVIIRHRSGQIITLPLDKNIKRISELLKNQNPTAFAA